MALTSGTKLGPYEIQLPLGVGGMGEGMVPLVGRSNPSSSRIVVVFPASLGPKNHR